MVTVLSSAGGGGCALARHRCTVHADRAPAPGLASAWAPNVNRIFPLRISSYACRFADRTRWHRWRCSPDYQRRGVTIRGKICERVSTSLMYCGELQVLLSSVARSSESYSRS